MLSACDGSLEVALNMHMESLEGDPAADSPREDLEDIRTGPSSSSGAGRARAQARKRNRATEQGAARAGTSAEAMAAEAATPGRSSELSKSQWPVK